MEQQIAVGKTPQGQTVIETPRTSAPSDKVWWGAAASILTDPLRRYGKLRANRDVPVWVKLEMLYDPVLAMASGFTGAMLVKAHREIKCADEDKRRFFEAVFRHWEHEFILQVNMAIALGAVGLIKRFAFRVPRPLRPEDPPVWTSNVIPYIIEGFDAVHPLGSSPQFGEKGHIFQGMHTPDGKVDVFFTLWLTLNQARVFGAYQGSGRLDNCYRDWWFKHFGGDMYIISLQKEADRVVQVDYPPGSDENGVPYRDTAVTIGNQVRGGATVALPSEVYTMYDPISGEERLSAVRKWALQFLEGSKSFDAFHELDDHHDRKMALGYLLPPQAVLDVTGGDLGGPTSADKLTRLAEELLLVDAADIDRHVNDYVFAPMERANFPEDSPPVTVETTGLAQTNLEQLFELVKLLLPSKPQYFNLLDGLERLNMPVQDEDVIHAEEAQAQKQADLENRLAEVLAQQKTPAEDQPENVPATALAAEGPEGTPLPKWPDDVDVPIGPEDVERAIREWDHYIPDAEGRGLLDNITIVDELTVAEAISGAETPRWGYNPQLKRYVNLSNGQILSYDQVFEWALVVREGAGDAIATWAGMVANGQLRMPEWQRVMREQIKTVYLNQYMAGKGGRSQMTPRDYGIIGRRLRDQYGRLDGFAADVAAGKLSTAQIINRARMYIDSAQQALVRGRTEAFGMPVLPAYGGDCQTQCCTHCLCDWVIEEVRDAEGNLTGWNATWRLRQEAHHCPDCPENARLWNPLFVPAGMSSREAERWRRREQERMLQARGGR
ncbi:MAG: hypothetical protein JXA21_06830 [Anaerolineae bacterium]|nr:hypothetical protein [Anaerolineae bacterium]